MSDSKDTATSAEVFEFPQRESQSDHYETLVLVPGTYNEEEATALFAEVKEIIAALADEITYEENMGRLPLGYTVAGSRHGNYHVWEFDMDKTKLAELNEKLRIKKGVDRQLTIKKRKRTPEEIAEEAERRRKHEEHIKKQMIEKNAVKEDSENESKNEAKKETATEEAPAASTEAPATPAAEEASEEKTEKKEDAPVDEKIDKLLEDNLNV